MAKYLDLTASIRLFIALTLVAVVSYTPATAYADVSAGDYEKAHQEFNGPANSG